MRSRLQIVGLLFASLTLSGAALAQQGGGGGRGGDGGSGGDSGGRDDSVLAIRRQDALRLALPAATSVPDARANCRTHACNMPPKRTAGPIILTGDGCSEQWVIDARQGRSIRRICRMN